MMTDWLIVRRLAAELDRAVRGARVKEAGLLEDGRFALRLPRGTLAIDAFGATPIVTYDDAREALRDEPGWSRTIAKSLEGMKVERVRARRADRLIAFDFAAQSRFGVATSYRLVCELVPRFGNVVLLKAQTVVAAAREFEAGARATRTVAAGETYEPPPSPGDAPAGAREALIANAHDLGDPLALARSLRAAVPLVPRLVAESLVFETLDLARAGANVEALAARALAKAEAIVAAADGESDGSGDVYVYRDGARIQQFHVVPLAQFGALACERVPALLPLCGEVIGGARRAAESRAHEDRLRALRARVRKRVSALESERDALVRERDDAASRDALRHAGDLLYAHIADVPARAERFTPPDEPETTIELDPDLDVKANAAAYFRRYRKAATKLEHVERRLRELDDELAFGADLAWELDRGETIALDDLADGVERLERKRSARARERRAAGSPRRRILEVAAGDDARIYVGRSPRENADVTFRIGRPDDLWFHARGIPSAHVILHLDTARAPGESEIERAAELAAHHSRARGADRVEVDYTERKYVRKRPGGAPGLVWYTNARTISVRPRASEPQPRPAERSSA